MNRHSAVVRTKLDEQSVENKGDSALWSSSIHHQRSLFNPFVPSAPLSVPPENIRKPYDFFMFLGGRKRVHWEQMG